VYDASCCEVVYRTVVRGLRCLLLRGYLLLCNVYTTVVSSATTCTAVRWVLYCTSYVPRVLYILLLGYLFLCEAPEDQRQETSSYSTRSFQIPTRRLEATAVGVSGSWFLRRETSKYSTRSLQIPTRRLEATAVGVSGSWFLWKATGHNIVKVRSVSKMHIPKLLVIQLEYCSLAQIICSSEIANIFHNKLQVQPC
jgi:hypothetical protein